SNIFLSIAMVKTNWVPRIPAWIALLLGVVAVCFEQPGEFWWVTSGVELAKQSLTPDSLAFYLAKEESIFARVSAWAPIFYT
ncbi:hypothetical protein ABTH81_22455, partial [Acinetobacter baumannii]